MHDTGQENHVNGVLHSEKVIILDAGTQYGKIIDRRVRELCVESVIFPLNTSAQTIRTQGYRAVIISGGPDLVYSEDAVKYDPEIIHCGIPVLGIYYGMQLINYEFGGTTRKSSLHKNSQVTVQVDPRSALFKGLDREQLVAVSQDETIDRAADGFKVIATAGTQVAAISNEKLQIYGVQFHIESDMTPKGRAVLRNFLYDIAGLSGSYTLQSRQQECIEYIRRTVGNSKVLMLVSGGVSSVVCTALLHKALKEDQVIALHIDTGLMRKNESLQVEQSLKRMGMKLKVTKAAHHFCNGTAKVPMGKKDPSRKRSTKMLCMITSSEEKRRIIEDTFVKVACEIMSEMNLRTEDVYLGQGTLQPHITDATCMWAAHNQQDYPFRRESLLFQELREQGRLIEPLKYFYRDEVVCLAKDLGLPPDIIHRHPFPDLGLAVRIVCAEEPHIDKDFSETSVILKVMVDYASALQKKHSLVYRIQNNLAEEDQEFLSRVSRQYQMTCTLLPIMSLGIQGERQSQGYIVGLSSNEELSEWEDMMTLARIIPCVCSSINRVCFVFGEVVTFPVQDTTPTFLTPGVLSSLRQADFLAHDILHMSGYASGISQMSLILLPIHFDRDVVSRQPSCQRSVVIRTFITEDYMTGAPAVPNKHIPFDVIKKMIAEILSVPGISRVLYDLTPGRSEWE